MGAGQLSGFLISLYAIVAYVVPLECSSLSHLCLAIVAYVIRMYIQAIQNAILGRRARVRMYIGGHGLQDPSPRGIKEPAT
jgi:hypothetical protein